MVGGIASASGAPVSLRLDWHPTLDTPGAAQLGARFRRRTGQLWTRRPGEAGWRSRSPSRLRCEPTPAKTTCSRCSFDGHKGQPLRFSEDGHLVQPTCRLVAGRAVLTAPVDHDLLIDAD